MKTKTAFLIISLIFFSVFLTGCNMSLTFDKDKPVVETDVDTASDQPIGGETDEHGCMLMAATPGAKPNRNA